MLKKHSLLIEYHLNEITIFHVYWYGNLTRKQLLCINSYLATQNLKKTKLWVWLDEDTYNIGKNNVPNHKKNHY